MRYQKYTLYWFALLALVFAGLPTSSARAEAFPDPFRMKFSRGGMHITLLDTQVFFVATQFWSIRYCDGSSVEFSKTVFLSYDDAFTYTAGKPMRQVKVATTNPYGDFEPTSGPPITVVARRSCSPPAESSKPACSHVELAREIHATDSETIAFRGSATIFSAGLKLPGVGDWIEIRRIAPESPGSRADWERSLVYQARSRLWQGAFPALLIPPGKYQGVYLIVRDELGQQGKCWVGSVTISP